MMLVKMSLGGSSASQAARAAAGSIGPSPQRVKPAGGWAQAANMSGQPASPRGPVS
jgi:hypothetical protein